MENSEFKASLNYTAKEGWHVSKDASLTTQVQSLGPT